MCESDTPEVNCEHHGEKSPGLVAFHEGRKVFLCGLCVTALARDMGWDANGSEAYEMPEDVQ